MMFFMQEESAWYLASCLPRGQQFMPLPPCYWYCSWCWQYRSICPSPAWSPPLPTRSPGTLRAWQNIRNADPVQLIWPHQVRIHLFWNWKDHNPVNKRVNLAKLNRGKSIMISCISYTSLYFLPSFLQYDKKLNWTIKKKKNYKFQIPMIKI